MVDHLPLPDNPLLDLIEDLAASGSELFHYPQIVFRHVGFPRPGYHCSAVHPQNIVHFEPLRVCSPFQTCQRNTAMEAKRRDSATHSPDCGSAAPTPLKALQVSTTRALTPLSRFAVLGTSWKAGIG